MKHRWWTSVHEIQVIERCDFDSAILKDDSHRDVPISVNGRPYLVDACDRCYRTKLEPILTTVAKTSRPGEAPDKVRPHRRKRRGGEAPKNGQAAHNGQTAEKNVACPDCTRKFANNVGLGIHRAKAHGYESPNKPARVARGA